MALKSWRDLSMPQKVSFVRLYGVGEAKELMQCESLLTETDYLVTTNDATLATKDMSLAKVSKPRAQVPRIRTGIDSAGAIDESRFQLDIRPAVPYHGDMNDDEESP